MTLNGFDDLKRKAERIKRNLEDEVNDTVQSNLERTRVNAQGHILDSNTFHTGEMLSAFDITQTVEGGITRHRLINRAPYSYYVEFGTGSRFGTSPWKMLQTTRRPRAPPHTPGLTAAITNWVMTKPGFVGVRSPATAYKIAESISELGTHPHPFMRPAWFAVSGPMRGISNTSPFGVSLQATVRRVIRRS